MQGASNPLITIGLRSYSIVVNLEWLHKNPRRAEFRKFLHKYGVDYDEQYVWG